MSEPADLRFTDPEPRIHPTAELKSCRLGRYAAIGERVILREVSVGDYSYFERHAEAIYTTIGKFCSIAANSRINALEHPLERLTMHKVSYRPNEYFRYLGVDEAFRQRRQGKRVTIGNDVWIGHGAVVMPGVSDRQWRGDRRQCGGDARRRRLHDRRRQSGQGAAAALSPRRSPHASRRSPGGTGRRNGCSRRFPTCRACRSTRSSNAGVDEACAYRNRGCMHRVAESAMPARNESP